MGLFKRIGNLLSANLNELVEHCEDPERMLKQAIRELEITVGRSLDAAARAIARQRLLERQWSQERRQIERAQQAAAAAVQHGDDDAARRALRRKAETERSVGLLAEQVEAARHLADRLRRQVSTMRNTLTQAKSKLLDVTARNRAAVARRQFAAHLQSSAGQEDCLTSFEQICSAVEQAEAESEALLELLNENLSCAALETDIEAELAALKENASHVAH